MGGKGGSAQPAKGIGEAELSQAWVVAAPLGSQPELCILKSGYDSSSPSDLQGRDSGISDSSLLVQDSQDVDNGRERHVEELPEVKVDFQLASFLYFWVTLVLSVAVVFLHLGTT